MAWMAGPSPAMRTKYEIASAAQPRAQPHCVVAEDFPPRGFAEARALDGLLHRFGPRRVAVRPVAREQPHILAQLLDAEFERALPAVDAVEIAALGDHVARHPLQIRHMARRHQVMR